MTELTVVVAAAATVCTQGESPLTSAELLTRLEPEDEVIWVLSDASPVPQTQVLRTDDPRRVRTVTVAADADLGTCYAAGLARAQGTFVAFTDTATVPSVGWRSAAVAALRGGAAVVGGPVLPSHPRSLSAWAGFFVEYGPHAVPPYVSATRDVAANNVAYSGARLRAVVGPDEAVWKTTVNTRLRRDGSGPILAASMSVRSTKSYGLQELGPGRITEGRRYGAQRSIGWSTVRRLAAAMACAGLPPLAYARLAARICRGRQLRARFAVTTPLVVWALASWSMGETLGYLTGRNAVAGKSTHEAGGPRG